MRARARVCVCVCVCARARAEITTAEVGSSSSVYMTCVWEVSGGKRRCSWLRHCATSRKVAGSIPSGVVGIFH